MCYNEVNMKIATMVRSFLQTPASNDIAYSPATVALNITDGLVKRGHDVTFFGPEGSVTSAKLETCGIRAQVKTQQEFDDLVGSTELFVDYQFSLYDAKMAQNMLERASKGEFDCVLFHHFESVLPLAKLYPKVPVIYILHDYLDVKRREVIEMHTSANQYFISISNSQRRDAPDLNYVATVYNGIDVEHFTFSDKHEDYLMISGRITPEKGIKEAVQVAVQSDRRLLIAGSLSKPAYWYFDEHVKPFLNDKILYLGMLDKEQLVKYYKKAAGLLMPIQWQEPFGLSMIEANACGTPVIAFNRGSVPEIVIDGKTGYIVDNSAEMILAIAKLGKIKRKDCHEHVTKKFSRDCMVVSYEKALLSVISQHSVAKKPKKTVANHKTLTNKINKISQKIVEGIRGTTND